MFNALYEIRHWSAVNQKRIFSRFMVAFIVNHGILLKTLSINYTEYSFCSKYLIAEKKYSFFTLEKQINYIVAGAKTWSRK